MGWRRQALYLGNPREQIRSEDMEQWMWGDLLKTHTLEEIKGCCGNERLVELMREDGQVDVRQDTERGLDPEDAEPDDPHT